MQVQSDQAPVEHEVILRRVLRAAPDLHQAGALPQASLRALLKHARLRHIAHSVETGSGASTLLLSHLSDQHLVFALDAGNGSVENIKSSPLLRNETVQFIEGVTQVTLPAYEFKHPLQLVLLDGPHGWPFPDLEYYHLYWHVEEGGLLVIDNIDIPTVRRMFDVLRADAMWRLDEVATNTAFFTRTGSQVFNRYGDGWWEQGYNSAYPLPAIDGVYGLSNSSSGKTLDNGMKPDPEEVINDLRSQLEAAQTELRNVYASATWKWTQNLLNRPVVRSLMGGAIKTIAGRHALAPPPAANPLSEKKAYEYQPQNVIPDAEEAFRMLSARISNPVRRGWVQASSTEVTGKVAQDLHAAGIPAEDLSYSQEEFDDFLNAAEYESRYPLYYRDTLVEKSFEHFVVCRLLNAGPQDVFIDVACEQSPLTDVVYRLTGAVCYAQDIMFAQGIHDYRIGGDACAMPVEDGFATLAALTCSLEHFEGDSDTRLFGELSRVLRPGGKICIVPLYLFTEPAVQTDPRYSATGDVTFDADVTVYGSDGFGNRHGRWYSVPTLLARILKPHENVFNFRIRRIIETDLISKQIYARWALVAERKSA